MTSHDHRYLNGDRKANLDDTPAIIIMDRSSPVISRDETSVVATERFTIQPYFPLFDSTSGGSVIIRDSNGNDTNQVIDWTPKAQKGYLYNYRHVAEAVSTALNTACVTAGVSANDVPAMVFNDSTSKFSITSTSTFRSGYTLLFDSNMYRFFNTFDYENQATEYELLLNEDIEIQRNGTLEFLSPVKRIVIQTDMSVESEMLPPPSGTSQNAVSQYDSAFLVDYDYFQLNSNPQQSIAFNASDSAHRWHNVKDGASIQNVRLFFRWVDIDNNVHLITMKQGCTVTCKLYFLVDT